MAAVKKSVSVKDVARLAGVSEQTVSRTVHDSPSVRPETKERVRAAMRELGYRPNFAGKLGIDIGQNEIDRQEHTIGRLPYENKPSTLQDLEAAKHTEVDMFAGTVVRLGKELGVETPVCECFLHGIHLIEDRMFGVI